MEEQKHKYFFPMKNMVINTLAGFLKKDKYRDYEAQRTESTSYFQDHIDHYRDLLGFYKQELEQIIHHTSQRSINAYFHELSNNLEGLIESREALAFVEEIQQWNAEEMTRFQGEIQKGEEQYFAHDDRKRKHLEEYEVDEYFPFLFGLGSLRGNDIPIGKKKVTNYNFYCADVRSKLYDEGFVDEFLAVYDSLYEELVEPVRTYGGLWSKGELQSQLRENGTPKPVVFVEGVLDIEYTQKAAQLLGKEDLIRQVEFKVGDGHPNLDNIWRSLKTNWEENPRRILLLYDCDVSPHNEHVGTYFRQTMPAVPGAPIEKGIENLFPLSTILRAIKANPALVDVTSMDRTQRGVKSTVTKYAINTHEKRNLCNWLLENGTAEDFQHFGVVFELIERFLSGSGSE